MADLHQVLQYRETFGHERWRKHFRHKYYGEYATNLAGLEYFVRRLELAEELKSHEGCINTVRWNASGTMIVSGSDDCHLGVWRLSPYLDNSSKLISYFKTKHQANIFHAVFVPETNDDEIISCALDHHVYYNILSRQSCKRIGTNDASCHKLDVISRNEFITCSEDGYIKLIDMRDRSTLYDPDNPLALNNALVKLAKIDHAPPLLNDLLANNESPQPHSTYISRSNISSMLKKDSPVCCYTVTLNPSNNNIMAVGCQDQWIRLYDRRRLSLGNGKGAIPYCLMTQHACYHKKASRSAFMEEEGVTGLAWSYDGKELVATFSHRDIALFDLYTPRTCANFNNCVELAKKNESKRNNRLFNWVDEEKKNEEDDDDNNNNNEEEEEEEEEEEKEENEEDDDDDDEDDDKEDKDNKEEDKDNKEEERENTDKNDQENDEKDSKNNNMATTKNQVDPICPENTVAKNDPKSSIKNDDLEHAQTTSLNTEKIDNSKKDEPTNLDEEDDDTELNERLGINPNENETEANDDNFLEIAEKKKIASITEQQKRENQAHAARIVRAMARTNQIANNEGSNLLNNEEKNEYDNKNEDENEGEDEEDDEEEEEEANEDSDAKDEEDNEPESATEERIVSLSPLADSATKGSSQEVNSPSDRSERKVLFSTKSKEPGVLSRAAANFKKRAMVTKNQTTNALNNAKNFSHQMSDRFKQKMTYKQPIRNPLLDLHKKMKGKPGAGAINDGENQVPISLEMKLFRGHRTVETVKECNFLGPRSEYVMSGSDCGHAFIWRKSDGEIINILQGDARITNVVQGNPVTCSLVTAGLDDTVKYFIPTAESPNEMKEKDTIVNDNQNQRPSRFAASWLYLLLTRDLLGIDAFGDEPGNLSQ